MADIPDLYAEVERLREALDESGRAVEGWHAKFRKAESLLAKYEGAENSLVEGWRGKGLPPEPEFDDVWTLQGRIDYLLYLSDPAVAVEERTKHLTEQLAAADRLAEEVESIDLDVWLGERPALTSALAAYRAARKEGSDE